MVKAVFFDVANTLLYKPALFESIKNVLDKTGHSIPQQDIIEKHKILSELTIFPDKTSRQFYEKFNGDLLSILGILPEKILVDRIFEVCTYQLWQPFDDTSFLEKIKLPIGILSNWDNSLESKLQLLPKISFSWILGSEAEKIKKPDRRFFKKMIEASGLLSTEILYVGDSLKLDIFPANQLGIQSILIDRDNLFTYSSVKRVTSLHQLGEYI